MNKHKIKSCPIKASNLEFSVVLLILTANYKNSK